MKFAKRELGEGRFSFVTPTALSKHAVVRNKVRRRLRAIVRSLMSIPYPPFDVVLFAYKGAEDLSFADLEAVVCELLQRAHIHFYKKTLL
ncbi:MAG: hypothetical protein A3C84_01620 [Candidatus Ryanbacteria bacterium RIFCSPHIGHO2_02_FULL_48_12]|nr:MAG: hypothetical protein A3C84_01620 [Candidatus Ryanbacteria bacterium RIFCSPHIGHO2_02_FULL_48_12]